MSIKLGKQLNLNSEASASSGLRNYTYYKTLVNGQVVNVPFELTVDWTPQRGFVCACQKGLHCEHIRQHIQTGKDRPIYERMIYDGTRDLDITFPVGAVEIKIHAQCLPESEVMGNDSNKLLVRLSFNEDLYLWLDQDRMSAGPLLQMIEDVVANSEALKGWHKFALSNAAPITPAMCANRHHSSSDALTMRKMFNAVGVSFDGYQLIKTAGFYSVFNYICMSCQNWRDSVETDIPRY